MTTCSSFEGSRANAWRKAGRRAGRVTNLARRNRVLAAVSLATVLLLLVLPVSAEDAGWSFYRGINLNGPPLAIDGYPWDGDATARDYVCQDERFENQRVALRPAADDVFGRMIRSSRWRANGRNAITLTNVPSGHYRVYLYNWEDSDPQTFSVSLEGQRVLTDFSSGARGTWTKLGPWDIALDDGRLDIRCEGGHANLSGLEVWRKAEPAPSEAAVRSGLVALYSFDADDGQIVRDTSGVDEPLDLRIETPGAIRWQDGHLIVHASAVIASPRPARKIVEHVKASGEITIEAWIRPATERQSGPARIVTLSADPSQRNWTLGQEESQYDVRLRTTATSANGTPSLTTTGKPATRALTHVVFTRDRSHTARIYIGGRQETVRKVDGALENWSESFRLALANELSGDRPWLGELHRVAVYSRALGPAEVARNFRAGASAERAMTAGKSEQELAAEQRFQDHVAPILARHCLECHDPATKKGQLDLSRKGAALAGGESGVAIVPSKPDESLLWQLVAADEMPANRTPLTDEQKGLLREWIASGAAWPVEVIDPVLYAHDTQSSTVWVQRLTVAEYIETVRQAVGVDIAEDARRLLPPDVRADGFSNTAYNLTVDLKHVEAYAQLAERIVARLDVDEFTDRFAKSRSLSTDDTMREFVAELGKWLLRGPLDQREETSYSGVATTVASAGGDFREAAAHVIEAMLQSPRFIYRIERHRGDGTLWPVDQYELASRLSYILWGGPPDEELLRAAEASQLADREQCAAQVRRMLEDPRAIQRSRQFVTQWLNLDRLDNLQPNKEKFPHWTPQLAADMREETLAFFEEVAWTQNRPLWDLLNAELTFVTPRLAEHYRLPAGLLENRVDPSAGEPQPLQRVDLKAVSSRGGLLTHGSVLTIGGDEASMVTRGLFVLKDLLRGSVNDPPPCVDTTPVATKEGLTQRAIAEARIANPNCGICHARFEPFAFGLERFDGLGSYHETDEHGNPLRDDGGLLFPGNEQSIAYETSAELMDLLAESPRVRETITWKLAQFALGRPLTAQDTSLVERVHHSAHNEGGTYRDILTALVLSDLVQKTRTEIVP